MLTVSFPTDYPPDFDPALIPRTKKLKNKQFAAKVNREDITKGAADFGVELDEHIAFVVEALVVVALRVALTRASRRFSGLVNMSCG